MTISWCFQEKSAFNGALLKLCKIMMFWVNGVLFTSIQVYQIRMIFRACGGADPFQPLEHEILVVRFLIKRFVATGEIDSEIDRN